MRGRGSHRSSPRGQPREQGQRHLERVLRCEVHPGKSPGGPMSTKFIRQSEVRKVAKEKGKKVGSSFLAWLDREVMTLVQNSIHSLGGKTILNAEDAEAYD